MFGIGPYLWIDDGQGGYWGQPGAVGMIDLASYAQIVAAKPGQPRGVGMFQFAPDASTKAFVDAGGVLLSSEDPREGTPDGKGLDAIESMLGYRPAGNRWSDCLWDILTAGADPMNQDAVGILVPTRQGYLELLFAGAVYGRRRFDIATDPHAEKVKALLIQQLTSARELAKSGNLISPITKLPDLEYDLRIADATVEKYAGLNPQKKAELFAEFKASLGWTENLKPHATTLTESFNKADSATLGPDQTWVEDAGDSEVFSNQVRGVTSQSICRANSVLSSADQYSQISCVDRGSTTGGPGVISRKTASSVLTFYLGSLRNASDDVQLNKVITGTFTQLGSNTAVTVSLPQTIKLTCSGTTISVIYDGATKISLTDTAIDGGSVGGLATGFRLGWSVNKVIADNWEAGDLVAGQPTMRRFGMTNHCRAPLSIGTEGVRFF